MGRYKLVVMSDPLAGQEDEFNAWYTDRHLADVVAQQGFHSAQRFRLRSLTLGEFRHRYLAIYDMDTDEPEAAVEELMRLQGSEALPLSPAFDLDTVDVAVFEACSEPAHAPSSKSVALPGGPCGLERRR